jgi:hypothetical protein
MKRIIRSGLIISFSALSLCLVFSAQAADPGDACTSAKDNSWIVSDSDPNVRIYCDGTQYRVFTKIDESGAAPGMNTRPSVKVYCSVKERGVFSQPASLSFGVTWTRQVSASFKAISYS